MKAHEHNGHGEHAVEDRINRALPPGAQRGTPNHPPVRSVAVWGPIAAAGVLVLFVVIGVGRHMRAHNEQESFAQQINRLTVDVVDAERDEKPKDLVLPGTFQAIKQTTIYPRSNGYVESWKVDIGDNVQAGQLLAEIATPEVDQQLAQARAQEEIAKVTADRWRDLVQKSVVSKQEYDQNQKAYEAAKANLQQLEKIQGFQQILAPFAGKISAEYRCGYACDRRDRKFWYTAFQPRPERCASRLRVRAAGKCAVDSRRTSSEDSSRGISRSGIRRQSHPHSGRA